jgi:hypothetical protein
MANLLPGGIIYQSTYLKRIGNLISHTIYVVYLHENFIKRTVIEDFK